MRFDKFSFGSPEALLEQIHRLKPASPQAAGDQPSETAGR